MELKLRDINPFVDLEPRMMLEKFAEGVEKVPDVRMNCLRVLEFAQNEPAKFMAFSVGFGLELIARCWTARCIGVQQIFQQSQKIVVAHQGVGALPTGAFAGNGVPNQFRDRFGQSRKGPR